MLWGPFNWVLGYVLVARVGHFELRRTQDARVVGVGGLLMTVLLTQVFGRLYGGA